MSFLIKHFWGKVGVRAAEGLGAGRGASHILPRQPEICQHCVAFLVNDHIVGLKVSEDDVLFMKSLNSKEYLLDVEPRLILTEALFNLQVLAQVATWAVI